MGKQETQNKNYQNETGNTRELDYIHKDIVNLTAKTQELTELKTTQMVDHDTLYKPI